MNSTEVERLTNALVRKMSNFMYLDEDMESVIRTTVADTWLVVDGYLSVEDFESE